MYLDTRYWVCPALCGCELQMRAKWAKPLEPNVNGKAISYQHPVPGTIENIVLGTVCNEHTALLTEPWPPDPHFGCPGYLVPLPSNPTPAERLYVHLYKYSGQKWKPESCGCHIYEIWDRTSLDKSSITKHPAHTHKCHRHKLDDHQHTTALANQRLLNKVMEVAELLGYDRSRVIWDFDGASKLWVTLQEISESEKLRIQTLTEASTIPKLLTIV